MVELTILMDNSSSGHRSLKSEHGFSAMIEEDGISVLFDTGSSDLFLDNARMLDKDVAAVDVAVISHGHYDHTGGFPSFARQWSKAGRTLIVGRDFFFKRYEPNSYAYAYLGAPFQKNLLDHYGIALEVCLTMVKISPSCSVVSSFTRTNDLEQVPERFLVREGQSFRSDDFSDECSIVIEARDGLHMLVGCSHFGIMNMVAHVAAQYSKPVVAVYGGVHLMNADEGHVATVLKGLQRMGVQRLGLCHCSGNLINAVLERNLPGEQRANLAVGSVLLFD